VESETYFGMQLAINLVSHLVKLDFALFREGGLSFSLDYAYIRRGFSFS